MSCPLLKLSGESGLYRVLRSAKDHTASLVFAGNLQHDDQRSESYCSISFVKHVLQRGSICSLYMFSGLATLKYYAKQWSSAEKQKEYSGFTTLPRLFDISPRAFT